MATPAPITSQFWNESTGHCDCCGRTSKTIWGDLSDQSGSLAVYFVQWTVSAPEHDPIIDLIIGPWGEGSEPAARVLVSLAYRPSTRGGSFMVVDAVGRRADDRKICGRALSRHEVINTLLAEQAFSLVDALWLTEPRIAEVRDLNRVSCRRSIDGLSSATTGPSTDRLN